MKQMEVTIMGQSYILGCPDGGEQALLEAVGGRGAGRTLTAAREVVAAAATDSAARAAVSKITDRLSAGLASLVNVLNPDRIVLGGLYARAWAYASVGELARIAVVVAAGSLAGVIIFYGVLVPLGVPGTATAAGQFPRSFFVLEGMLSAMNRLSDGL